jgi:hypothetical protein
MSGGLNIPWVKWQQISYVPIQHLGVGLHSHIETKDILNLTAICDQPTELAKVLRNNLSDARAEKPLG